MPNYQRTGKGQKWSVRFRVTQNGKLIQKRLSGFPTKHAAEKAYIEFIGQYKPDEFATPDMKFGDLALAYMANAKTRLKPSGFYTKVSRIETHVLPTFANRVVADITPLDILAWQNSLNGFSYEYKNAIRSSLASIFRFGHRYYNLPNPIVDVEPFTQPVTHKEMSTWTPEEFYTCLPFIKNETEQLYFEFLFLSGCRRGEAEALQWQDINFATGTVSISKSVTRKTDNGLGWLITMPKNQTSVRKISMPAPYMDKLQKRRTAEHTPSDWYVFGTSRPPAANNLTRHFNEAIAASGVKRIRIHDLRHSHATYLLSSGASITAVSRRLGHKNVTQTLNTYSHVMDRDLDVINSVLTEMVK